MASVRSIALLVLPLLPIGALYSFYSTATQEGLVDALFPLTEPGQYLPNTKLPIRQTYTGIKGLDDVLTLLVGYWWPTLDGNTPDSSLYALQFTTQMASLWVVLMIESERRGNKWRAISFISIFGLCMQTISFAVTMPTYAIIHLLTAPVPSSSRRADLTVPASKLGVMPWAIALGCLIPQVLACLPAPQFFSLETKQAIIAFWNPFPLWVSIFLPILATVSSAVHGNNDDNTKNSTNLRQIRRVYTVAAFIGRTTHIFAVTVTLTAYLFPSLFASGVASGLSSTFKVVLPWTTIPPASVGVAAYHFIHWDQVFGSLGLIIWGLVDYRSAVSIYRPSEWEGWLFVLRDTVLSYVLEGPAAAVVRLIRSRDEVVLGEGYEDVRGKKTK